jgi:M6 family metalloprotease-like protein
MLQGAFAPSAYPATVNVLFLRVDFDPESTDDPGTTGDGTWADETYSYSGDPDHWVNNARTKFPQYWNEVSYGHLTVNIAVSPAVYRLSHPMAHYGAETNTTIENLIYDSVIAADHDIDFSGYDVIFLVHAGAGEETDILSNTTRDIWSLSYSSSCITPDNASGACLVADGKQITEAILLPQTDVQDGITVDPFGVYLHEFGHWLGLPDLYCTSLICLLDGVGDWSLMDQGSYNADPADPATCSSNPQTCIYGSMPAHLDAWSKVYLGWASPQTLAASPDPGAASLHPIELDATPEIIKLPASTGTASQYFLLENRQQEGFDRGLPGHGLLVWLVDEDTINSRLATNTVNNSRLRPGVKLIEADGNYDLMDPGDGDIGSGSDPFPGTNAVTFLTPHTVPSSQPYTSYGWVNVTAIAESTGLVTFNVGFSPLPPRNAVVSGTMVFWGANTEPDLSYYQIYKNGSPLLQTDLTDYTDGNPASDDVYAVSAVDSNGNESVISQAVAVSPAGGGSGGPCFIATAAYGSAMAEEVNVLRRFRDNALMKSAIGREFIRWYYQCSPPAAAFIRRHETMRLAVRGALTPVVYIIKYPFAAVAGAMAMAGAFVLVRRRRGRAAA